MCRKHIQNPLTNPRHTAPVGMFWSTSAGPVSPYRARNLLAHLGLRGGAILWMHRIAKEEQWLEDEEMALQRHLLDEPWLARFNNNDCNSKALPENAEVQ